MMNLLFYAKELEKGRKEVWERLIKLEVSNHDRLEIEDESIGINTIRLIKKWYKRKPVAGKYHVVIIYEAERMTLEAQNALLKALEEPPTSLLFFLTTANIGKLLPTIVSRLTIVSLPTDASISTKPSNTLLIGYLKALKTHEKLGLAAEVAATVASARKWAFDVLQISREDFLSRYLTNETIQKTDTETLLSQVRELKNTQKLCSVLETNVNPRLAIEAYLFAL